MTQLVSCVAPESSLCRGMDPENGLRLHQLDDNDIDWARDFV